MIWPARARSLRGDSIQRVVKTEFCQTNERKSHIESMICMVDSILTINLLFTLQSRVQIQEEVISDLKRKNQLLSKEIWESI